MNDSSFPEGVGLQFFDIPYWHAEGANFALHKEEYNNETLARVDAMAALYPQASGVFALLKEELDGRLPSGVVDEEDRSGGYVYDKTTRYGLGHQDVFRIVAAFPPTEEQYRLLRHFLFTPDLSVREQAANAISIRLSSYSDDVVADFRQQIEDDPDYINRLKIWQTHRDEYDAKSPHTRMHRYLADIPIDVPPERDNISVQDLRIYFGIGRDNYYRPAVASEKQMTEEAMKQTRAMLDDLEKIIEMAKAGDPAGLEAARAVARERDDAFPDFMRSNVPNLQIMMGQAYRLDKLELVHAVGNVIDRPETFNVSPFSSGKSDFYNDSRNVALAVLASSLLDSPPGQKLILESVTKPGNKWIKSPRVVEAITRASYTLDVDYILDTVFPLLEDVAVRKEVNMRYPAEALAYAIARDIAKEEVPTYTSKEIPFFGF